MSTGSASRTTRTARPGAPHVPVTNSNPRGGNGQSLKLKGNSSMVVYQDFIDKALGQFQTSKLSALSQAIENSRETNGRLNATEVHIDLKTRDTDLGTGDMELLTILDNGEGTCDLLENLSLGHAKGHSPGNDLGGADGSSTRRSSGGGTNYNIGKFGVGLNNVCLALGSGAYLLSIPKGHDDLMCVARHGSAFQDDLVEPGLRKHHDTDVKQYAAYYRLNGEHNLDVYQDRADHIHSDTAMFCGSNPPFKDRKQLMRAFDLIKGLPASAPGQRGGHGTLIVIYGLKKGLEVTDTGDIIEPDIDLNVGFQGMQIASVYLAQMFLPPSTELFPRHSERMAAQSAPFKSLAITLNGRCKVETKDHLWELAVKAGNECDHWDMKPSEEYRVPLRNDEETDANDTVDIYMRHAWQAATHADRAKELKEKRSGILIAVKDRCYAMNPTDFINIYDIVCKLQSVSNKRTEGHKSTYRSLMQLTNANADQNAAMARPTLSQFLSLEKAGKRAVIGEGLLTVVRCDALYAYTDIAKEGFRSAPLVNEVVSAVIKHRIQWAYDHLPGDIVDPQPPATAAPSRPATLGHGSTAAGPAAAAGADAAASPAVPRMSTPPPRATTASDGANAARSPPGAPAAARHATQRGRTINKPTTFYTAPDFRTNGAGGSGTKRKASSSFRVTPTDEVKRLKAERRKTEEVLKEALEAWDAQRERMVHGDTARSRERAAETFARHVSKMKELPCLATGGGNNRVIINGDGSSSAN